MSDLPPQPPVPPWEQKAAPTPSRPDPHGPRDEEDRTPGVQAKPRASLRGGPDSFSMVGKLVWTAVILAIGLGLYWLGTTVGSAYGGAGLALVMLFVGLYVVIAGGILWAVWRPGRIDDPTARPQIPPSDSGRHPAGSTGPSDPNASPRPPSGPEGP